jgi:hypothetical protein
VKYFRIDTKKQRVKNNMVEFALGIASKMAHGNARFMVKSAETLFILDAEKHGC